MPAETYDDRVREMREETKQLAAEARQQAKDLRKQLEYAQTLSQWLDDFEEEPEEAREFDDSLKQEFELFVQQFNEVEKVLEAKKELHSGLISGLDEVDRAKQEAHKLYLTIRNKYHEVIGAEENYRSAVRRIAAAKKQRAVLEKRIAEKRALLERKRAAVAAKVRR
ncbi:hypothetical protein M3Y99_00133000 [Aphelenchoides fujianensis]|nr:hypothetical protein M3Y99_00133000 [Aphelenchoides fujianensis]